jgi:hypothetical protein
MNGILCYAKMTSKIAAYFTIPKNVSLNPVLQSRKGYLFISLRKVWINKYEINNTQLN